MQIEINPEAEFSTGEVDRMLMFRPGRTKLLCDKELIPFIRKGGEPSKGGMGSHFRVKFKDFAKVIEADKATKSIDRNNPQVTIKRTDYNELIGKIGTLEERLQYLESELNISRGAVSG